MTKTKLKGGFMGRLKENAYSIIDGSVNGSLGVVSTSINKGTDLANSLIGESLTTTTAINASTQQVIQKTVKATSDIIQGTVDTTAKLTNAALDTSVVLTKDTLKTTEKVSAAALNVVGVNSENAASILNKGGTEGTKVINEAIQQSGDIAVKSLSTAGNSLQVLIGTVNNVTLEKLQKVNARRDVMELLRPSQRLSALKGEIEKMFNDRMDTFIVNLREYSSNQSSFIRKKLGLYQLMHCKPGKLWGSNCSSANNLVVKELGDKLKFVQRETEAGIHQLVSIKSRLDSVLLPIFAEKNTEEEFQEKAHVAISQFYKESGDLFIQCTNKYNELSGTLEYKMKESINEINTQDKSVIIDGGRRKRRTKKRKLMRPRFRSRRT